MTAQPDETNYIPIKQIVVGERRREDYGDMEALKESINRYGLLHPVIVDSEKRLVAGGRRLRACEELGWAGIPARDWGDLDEDERREIELEENLQRKDLTSYERSKTLVELAETAGRVLVKEAESDPEFLPESSKNPKGGRPPKADADSRVAEKIGRPRQTIDEAKQQVETAEAFPFMQSPDWSQSAVLDARKLLKPLAVEERQIVADMVGQQGIPAPVGLEMIRKVATAPPTERAEFVRQARSADDREQSEALTWAATRAPEPDPQLPELREAANRVRGCIRRYPNDPHISLLNRAVSLLEEAVSSICARHKEKFSVPIDA